MLITSMQKESGKNWRYKIWVNSVQIRSFSWSVFSCIRTEYGKIQTRKNSVFRHFLRSENQGEYHDLYVIHDLNTTISRYKNNILPQNYIKLILYIFLSAEETREKKTEVELELLADVDILLMVGKGYIILIVQKPILST